MAFKFLPFPSHLSPFLTPSIISCQLLPSNHSSTPLSSVTLASPFSLSSPFSPFHHSPISISFPFLFVLPYPFLQIVFLSFITTFHPLTSVSAPFTFLPIFLAPPPVHPSILPIQRSWPSKFQEHYCCDGVRSGSVRQLVFTLQLTPGHGAEWWSARLVTNPWASFKFGVGAICEQTFPHFITLCIDLSANRRS